MAGVGGTPRTTGLPRRAKLASKAVGLRRKHPGRRRRKRRLDLKKTLFVLPNAITLGSIFCGFNAILIVSTGSPSGADFYKAAMLLIFAMFFDLLDGRVARMTKTQSAFGLQIDSLADIVSLKCAPSRTPRHVHTKNKINLINPPGKYVHKVVFYSL